MSQGSDPDLALKDAFALAWLKTPSDPFKAAISVFGPIDVGKALRAADEWVKDEYVINRKAQLVAESGQEAFLPTKAELALKVMSVADESRFADDKIKALRLYAEIMGHIEKPDNKSKGNGQANLVITDQDANL